jgi:hypothetical protein
MKKLIFLPIFLFGITTYPDFSMCYKKYKNLSIIPISKHYSITSTPLKKYVKYDKLLGIYLIKTNNKHYIHFKKSHLGVWLASIKKGSIYSGNYAEYQKDLYTPAKLSTTTKVGSIITDIFCNPIGIGVNGGFLSKSYIKKFITAKVKIIEPLKFLGIIVDDNLVITKILPNSIASKYYIHKGAKIVKINNKKVTSKKDLLTDIKTITIFDGFNFTFKVKQ